MQIKSRIACVCLLFRRSITDHKEFLVLDMRLLPQGVPGAVRVPSACTDKGGELGMLELGVGQTGRWLSDCHC